MKVIKMYPIDQMLADARRKQAEFDALSPEEQAKTIEEREEILKQLRGPGFVELGIGKGERK